MQKSLKMIETLANGYSYESTQRELSNEYRHDRVKMIFKKSLHSCALDKSILCIARVEYHDENTETFQRELFPFMGINSP